MAVRNCSDTARGRGTILARLARDTRGNTLAIVGASLFPLVAMLGSGIDMSRSYMAQTRLQQACDAAALAGRRAMTTGVVDAAVTAEAKKFFNFNYPYGTDGVAGSAAFGATGFTPAVTGAANSTVVVEASTVVPTTLMKIFGYASLPLGVKCNAKLDFVNTDIVLVLDTTGSMAQKAVATDTDTKIVAMRKAVLGFYDVMKPIQTQLETAGLRLRYSVVPYASSINTGRVLRGVDSNYVASDNWTYQSREPLYQHVVIGSTSADCTAKSGTTSAKVGSGSSATYTCTYSDTNSAGGTFSGWKYAPETWDLSSYATGSSTQSTSIAGTATPTPTRTPGSSATSIWAGCIEERETTDTLTAVSTSIPATAKDLDIDLVPNSDKTTKWKPFWPEVEYLPSNTYQFGGENNKPQWACPAEAKRLQAWDRAALSTYLDTLNADGGTYHDNGMVWGIRMLSGSGVFSADNPASYKGMPVSKYMIFMTDGAFDTGYDTLYTTYGVEKFDKRVTPGGSASNESDQLDRHVNRFTLLCTVAKSRGISVWIVAFDQTLTTSLSNCASNANQASTSVNQAQLNARFVEIGKNIGALRLTQ